MNQLIERTAPHTEDFDHFQETVGHYLCSSQDALPRCSHTLRLTGRMALMGMLAFLWGLALFLLTH